MNDGRLVAYGSRHFVETRSGDAAETLGWLLEAETAILLAEQLVKPGTDLNKTVTDLVDTRFAAGLLRA